MMVEDHPKRRSDVTVRAVQEELVVLDRAGNHIHQLNPTATFIWHRCDGRQTVPEISDEVAGAFAVDHETAREAVITSVRRFAELGLLERTRD